jgi:hypothetical protein
MVEVGGVEIVNHPGGKKGPLDSGPQRGCKRRGRRVQTDLGRELKDLSKGRKSNAPVGARSNSPLPKGLGRSGDHRHPFFRRRGALHTHAVWNKTLKQSVSPQFKVHSIPLGVV